MIWLKRRLRRKANKLLSRGHVARAIGLLQRAEAWDALAAVYQGQGDLRAAAKAASRAGNQAQAAELLERAGAFAEAAELWVKASEKEHAALALERAEDFEAAADIYAEIKMPSRAANALAMLKHYDEAARLYEQAGELANAVKMYRAADQLAEAARVLEESGDHAGAARLHYEAGNRTSAAQLYEKAGNTIQSARCCMELGRYKEAGRLFENAGHLFEAAEVYEKEEDARETAADLFAKVFHHRVAWRREMGSSPTCLSAAPDGSCIAVGCSARRVQLLEDTGDLIWSFKPDRGGTPRCVALSANGRLAVGCDDRRLYFLDGDRTLLWSFRLSAEAAKVAVDRAGERILCSTKDNFLLCLRKEGTAAWEDRSSNQIWDVALSAEGNMAAIGTADGSCMLLTGEGEHAGQYKAADWVHSLSLSPDGALCAVATGVNGVELIDTRRLEPLWSATDPSPVHNVVLTPGNAVLSVGDEEALLRDESGSIIWRFQGQERLLGGDIDASQRFAAFRCVDRMLVRVDLLHCRHRAAAHYESGGNVRGAAAMYEGMGEHAKAAEMFKSVQKHVDAARNLAMAGRPLEAAQLYEKAQEFQRAANIYEEHGEAEKAANCLRQVGKLGRAGELFEQAGNLDSAATAYEQAGQHGRAGDLYKQIGQVPAAIKSWTQHLEAHPEDMERQLQLGVLMQEDGQHDTAIEQFQKTVGDERFRKASLVHMAECFVVKDLYDVAIARYKSCLKEGEEVSSDNIDVHYGLAKTYELAGNYAEATRIYQSILGVDYQYEDVMERLEEAKTLGGIFSQPGQPVAPGAQATIVPTTGQFQMLSFETKERYALKKLLGKGGMGEVYLAEDKRLRRTVALKILPSELASDEQFRLRMIREAQAVARISHPNVVAVFDVGEEAGRSYISMEYVQGQTLREILGEKGTFEPGECLALLRQLAEGLGCAHGLGITHRDMKPENVIVAEDGTAKIMDFGLALVKGATRLTMPGGVSGTWHYMAPEQVRGEVELTGAVDVYAVGCIAYELLTGKPPFTGDDAGMQHLAIRPTPLDEVKADLPAPLCDVIMKCLEKRAEDRYPDATGLNATLKALEIGP